MKVSLRTKVVAAVLLMAVMVAGVTGTMGYRTYARSMEEHYERLTMNTAKSAASMVDAGTVAELARQTLEIYRSFCPDENTPPDFAAWDEAEQAAYYAAFAEIVESPAYRQTYDTLNTLKEDNGVLWMYVAVLDAQTGQGIYVVDADTSESACPTGTFADIEPENLVLMEQGVRDFQPYITNYEEFGWLVSASVCITDVDSGVIANAYVDFSMNEVMADRQAFLLRLFIALATVTLVLILALAYLFTRTVVRPINQLAKATGSFVSEKQGNWSRSAISQLKIRTGDEIENLAVSVRQMEREINTYIDDLTRVTAERERIGAELDVARNIQASMLPCIFPPFPQRKEFSIFATMDPAKEVGGDFYDFFLVDDDHLALVMADVSGKGVPAAMFMVIAKTLLKNAAQTGASPKEVLEKVNDQLCENNDAEMFVTVWLGILDLVTGRMTYCSAGHNPPVVVRRGSRPELLRSKAFLVMGAKETAKYGSFEVDLEPGDRILLYTDGITEANDDYNGFYGTDRLMDVMAGNGDMTPEGQIESVSADVAEFTNGAEQFDDMTMLLLRYDGRA